jgi:hypothetical protein
MNLSVRGGGHFNGAHFRGEGTSKLGEVGYYGDPLEFAWSRAETWRYPALNRISFRQVWNWLIDSDFDRCMVAEQPVHKALVVLLEVSRHFDRTAASDVLLVAQGGRHCSTVVETG